MLKKISTAGQSLAQLQNQWQVRVWDLGAYKSDAIEKCELHNFCIDLCSMHKIDAKLKREEAWRMIVENHHILASAKLMPSVYIEKHNISKCKNKGYASLHLSPTGASTYWSLPSWCSIFEQDSNLRITSQTNANALSSEETVNKTSLYIGYWMYIHEEPYLLSL